MTWQCPQHGPSKVREGRYGPYCTQFLGIGVAGANNKGYCSQAAPKAAPAAVSLPPIPMGHAPADSDATLQAGALTFAAHLFHGAGPEMGDAAIALAIKAYSAMKAIQ